MRSRPQVGRDREEALGRQRQWESAVRLLGAAEGVAQALGRSQPVALPKNYQRTVVGARTALGEAAFAAAWEAGGVMPLEATESA